MNKEKTELIKQLENRRKELRRLHESEKEDDNPVNKDASKDEDRIKDEIADLKRKLKIIEEQNSDQ